MKISQKIILYLKKRSPIFYIFWGWVFLTFIFIFLNFPIISLNFNYYFGRKKSQEVQNIERKENTFEENIQNQKNFLEKKIVIPKIKVDAPIIEASSVREKDILNSLQNGVVHYPNTALPGEIGNVFLVGHSSNYRWAKGSYNYVFALLNKLQKDDLIIVFYNGVKYTYKVFEIKIVSPSDTSVLAQGNDSIISLMTCDPPGTTLKRRIVRGFQIEPDPKKNKTRQIKPEEKVESLVGI